MFLLLRNPLVTVWTYHDPFDGHLLCCSRASGAGPPRMPALEWSPGPCPDTPFAFYADLRGGAQVQTITVRAQLRAALAASLVVPRFASLVIHLPRARCLRTDIELHDGRPAAVYSIFLWDPDIGNVEIPRFVGAEGGGQ
jgi:hypothetical protein